MEMKGGSDAKRWHEGKRQSKLIANVVVYRD